MDFERAAQPQQRKTLEQMGDQEQQRRFAELKPMFSTSSHSPYAEFWDDAYKYTDKFKITGSDSKQTAKIFDDIKALNVMLSRLMDCFQEVKIHEENSGSTSQRENAIAALVHGTATPQLIDQKTGRVDKERTIMMLKWALDVFDKMTDRLARAHHISSEDQKAITEDISYIIEKTNRYLHQ